MPDPTTYEPKDLFDPSAWDDPHNVTGQKEQLAKIYGNMISPEVDPDGLYDKYRVFREPDNVEEHPVGMDAYYTNSQGREDRLEEVREFVFVLKPDSDHHARVALAAYAASVEIDKPQLAQDLKEVLGDL